VGNAGGNAVDEDGRVDYEGQEEGVVSQRERQDAHAEVEEVVQSTVNVIHPQRQARNRDTPPKYRGP